MNIKEVTEKTGLTAKTIRMYEEKGLLQVERNSNRYRDYDGSVIKRLNEIKLFRKLDIAIADIKKLFDGAIPIDEILSERLKSHAEDEKKLENQKLLCEALIRDYKSDKKDKCVAEYLNAIEYFESDEYVESEKTFGLLARGNWAVQALVSIGLSGPLLWLFINLSEKKYDELHMNLIWAFVSTVLLTLSWTWFIQNRMKYKDYRTKEHTGLTLLALILCVILTFAIFGIIEWIQILLFAPDDYLACGINRPGAILVFFFEIEFILMAVAVLGKTLNISYINAMIPGLWHKIFSRPAILGLVLINALVFVICIFSVTVVTANGINIREIGNFPAKQYGYDRVKAVETGYYTKGREKGFYYYIVKMDDNKKIVLTDCIQNDKLFSANDGSSDWAENVNSYLWLEMVDGSIMKYSVSKKSDLASESKRYGYDARYVKLFRRIMENQNKAS